MRGGRAELGGCHRSRGQDGGLDRVAPADVGEVVRFWAQLEEESPGFTMAWLVSAREEVWLALQLGPSDL